MRVMLTATFPLTAGRRKSFLTFQPWVLPLVPLLTEPNTETPGKVEYGFAGSQLQPHKVQYKSLDLELRNNDLIMSTEMHRIG